ncbi:MAG: SRPBCC family protein [Gemmatimonadaceae bacterium]
MKWVLIAVAVLAAVVLLVVITGLALPRAHIAARSARLAAPPERVWAMVSEPARFPTWRSSVTAVDALPPATDGRARWREIGGDGRITYELVAASPPRAGPGRLVTRIADPSLPFGGEWEMSVAASDSGAAGAGGTVVTITERGEVRNPIFRFVSRFVMGHASTIERYLRDLGRALGESVTPAPAPPASPEAAVSATSSTSTRSTRARTARM